MTSTGEDRGERRDLPAVKFEHFLAVFYKSVGNVARVLSGARGGLQLVQENLLVEGDDELHVAEDEVGLVSHAGVAGGHPVPVAGQNTVQVGQVLVLRLGQLGQNLLVSEIIPTVWLIISD